MIDIAELNEAINAVRVCVGLPDDLPINGCKEPEYAGGRARILRALVEANIINENDAMAWFRTYAG
jgi:predicted transcriptional regulator of viral defense system